MNLILDEINKAKEKEEDFENMVIEIDDTDMEDHGEVAIDSVVASNNSLEMIRKDESFLNKDKEVINKDMEADDVDAEGEEAYHHD